MWLSVVEFVTASFRINSAVMKSILIPIFLLFCSISSSAAANMDKYYKRTGKKFLDEKAKEPNIITLKSGMLVEILKQVRLLFFGMLYS